MIKTYFPVIFLGLFGINSYVVAADTAPLLFDVQTFCRASAEELLSALKATEKDFAIEETFDEAWGYEEDWSLSNKKILEERQITELLIRFEQGVVQSFRFTLINKPDSKEALTRANLSQVGLGLKDVRTNGNEYRVNATKVAGYRFKRQYEYTIRILDNASSYVCVEHRPGH